MKALVTGHRGFIGRHVHRALLAAGYEVTGWDLASGSDVRWQARVNYSRFDLAVHCAAVVGGRRVIDWTPIRHAANLEIDAAFFGWAVRTQPGRVVYFSSSCAYPVAAGRAGRRFAEDDIDLLNPSRPDGLYGWAKLTGELLAATAQDAGIPVTVVRPFSVYGPGMRPGFAVTGFCEQARQRADPLVIWGDADQTRDYIDARDVAAAVVALVQAGVDGPVNLGTGTPTSLRDLALLVAAAAGYAPDIKVDASMPAGVPWLVADTTRLAGHYQPERALAGYLAGLDWEEPR